MKFRYQKQLDGGNPNLPWKSRPIVKVKLSCGDRQQAFLALIDSGADITLFHSSVAELLGITEFEREGRVVGISGEVMPTHYHTLKLQLEGTDESIDIEAGFVDSPGVGALLGQAGFFEHYHICFDRKKEEIEIYSTRKR